MLELKAKSTHLQNLVAMGPQSGILRGSKNPIIGHFRDFQTSLKYPLNTQLSPNFFLWALFDFNSSILKFKYT